jgi:CP family cyanate transporter-like MFS transporter
MQVTMPPAVRTWFPERIGFATAVYTNGLIIGEILPVALMVLVLPLVDGSWQWGFVVWSVPVAFIAVLVSALAPASASANGTTSAARRRWWPDWDDPLIWRLGIMLGTINATYFATNAFLPDYLRSNGQSDWINAALTGLNGGQLPASALLLAVAGRLERKAWPYVVCGLLCIAATAGIVFGSGGWVVASATLQGFAASAILILILALPPLLSTSDDVHRVTAAMFTISYSCAVIVPVISGLAWDMSGIASFAFAPIAICGIILVMLAPAINHVGGSKGDKLMRPIPIGAKGTYTLRVTPAHLANQFKDVSLPQVFATPMMVTAMENAALNAVRDYLDKGESAVGTGVNIRHLAPTPVGHQVTAVAEVTKVDDRHIEFKVSARDEIEEIGNGTHERMVVNMGRLNKRLNAKKRP